MSVKTEGRPGRRRLAHQFAWVSSGRIVAALLQAVSLIIAARLLSVADFGHLAAFLGVTTLIQVAVDLGVSTLITRERAADPDSRLVATALKFTTISSTALVLSLFAGLGVAGAVLSSAYWSMLPLAVWAAGERNADARLSVAFADGDVHVNVLNLVTRRTGAIILLLLLHAAGVEPMLAFSLGWAAAAVGSASFARLYTRRKVTALPSHSFRELLRLAQPYWINGIATQARNLDVVLVGAVAGATQAGLYSSGSRLTSPLRIVPTSLATLLLPAAARRQASRQVLGELLRIVAFVTAGMTVLYGILIVFTPLVVDLVLGEKYAGAVPVIRTIVAGLPFAAAASLLGSVLQGRGWGRRVAVSSTAATSACLVGICAVTPWWGASGAAVALTCSFALQCAFLAVSVATLYRHTDPQEGATHAA